MSYVTTNRGGIDHWQGTTQYQPSQLRTYATTGTTDANGRFVINMTTTGLVGGPALFSSILAVDAIGVDASNNPLQAPLMFVEAISATSITFRGVRGVSQGILIGGTINTLQFAGAGYTVYVNVLGVKA